MRLSLVPKRRFDFTTFYDTDIAVPEEALAAVNADEPAPGTPACLREFRRFLSDWEASGADISCQQGWEVAYADFEEDRAEAVVPLVTPLYATTKVHEVFADWQAVRPERRCFRLAVVDALCPSNGFLPGLMIGMNARPEEE